MTEGQATQISVAVTVGIDIPYVKEYQWASSDPGQLPNFL